MNLRTDVLSPRLLQTASGHYGKVHACNNSHGLCTITSFTPAHIIVLFSLGALSFNTEEGPSMLLRNSSIRLQDYTVFKPGIP